MKIDTGHIILVLIVAGVFVYFNFFDKSDTMTEAQGKVLAEKSQEAINIMKGVLLKLNDIDSTQIIQKYYNTVYETSVQYKDSVVALDTNMVYALFRLYREQLLSGQSPITQ